MIYREISSGSFLCIAHKCIQCPESPQALSNTTVCPLLVGRHSFSCSCDFCLLMGHIICASCSWGFCCQVSLKNHSPLSGQGHFSVLKFCLLWAKGLILMLIQIQSQHTLILFHPWWFRICYSHWCELHLSFMLIFFHFWWIPPPVNLISFFDTILFNVILLSLLTFHTTFPSYTSFIFNIRLFLADFYGNFHWAYLIVTWSIYF